jgi:hypothetical protein
LFRFLCHFFEFEGDKIRITPPPRQRS